MKLLVEEKRKKKYEKKNYEYIFQYVHLPLHYLMEIAVLKKRDVWQIITEVQTHII